jgi:hypothetical protein
MTARIALAATAKILDVVGTKAPREIAALQFSVALIVPPPTHNYDIAKSQAIQRMSSFD